MYWYCDDVFLLRAFFWSFCMDLLEVANKRHQTTSAVVPSSFRSPAWRATSYSASCGKLTDYQTLRKNIVAPVHIILNAFFWPALQRLSCTPATLGLNGSPLVQTNSNSLRDVEAAESIWNYTRFAESILKYLKVAESSWKYLKVTETILKYVNWNYVPLLT